MSAGGNIDGVVDATATVLTTLNDTASVLVNVSRMTSEMSSIGILILLFMGLGLAWRILTKPVKDYEPSESPEVPDYDRDYDPKDYDCKNGKHAYQKLRLKQGGRDEVKFVCVLCGKEKGVGYSWT